MSQSGGDFLAILVISEMTIEDSLFVHSGYASILGSQAIPLHQFIPVVFGS